jgi:CRP-like cAMP-binding protein
VLGSVRAIKSNTRGSEETIATLGSRSYFGEMAMVSADDRRSATVQAVEDTHLIRISGDAVKALCEKDATFGNQFFAAVARGLARRLLSIGNDVSDLKAVARGA